MTTKAVHIDRIYIGIKSRVCYGSNAKEVFELDNILKGLFSKPPLMVRRLYNHVFMPLIVYCRRCIKRYKHVHTHVSIVLAPRVSELA